MKHPGWLIGVNVLFVALFVTSAGLQYNDPDPIRWAALYGAAALAALAALHARGGWTVAVVVGVVAAAWAGWLWHEVIGHVVVSDFWRKMSEKGGKVEEMREAGGLSIVAVWLAVTARAGWRRSRGR